MNFLLEEDKLAFELVFVQLLFPCNRSDCQFCSFVNSRDTIETTTDGRQIKNVRAFYVYNYLWRITTCITTHLITYLINRYLCHKCSGIVYIRETGRRLGDHLEEASAGRDQGESGSASTKSFFESGP